jgi:hypothetical protein
VLRGSLRALYAFRRIIGMAGESSPILSPSRLEMGIILDFGMMFGTVKMLSNHLSQN